MSPITVGIIGIAVLFVLLLLRMPIGFVMALVGVAGFMYLRTVESGFTILQTVPFTTAHSYGLAVIPLFVLMGLLCFWAGLSSAAYGSIYKWLGQLPGGLAMTTVGGCAAFAAVSGTSAGTLTTMGTVALPEMRKYKYDPRLAIGCICAGGTIGILIPPSNGFIVYAIITEQSIGKLFMAGLFPGILEAIFYITTIYIICKHNPLMGPPGPRTTWKDKLRALPDIWGILLLFVLVIGGIYMGIFSPTEAAGVGAFGALILGLGTRRLTRQGFITSLLDTGKLTVMIFTILIGAYIFGYFLTVTKIPMVVAGMLSELPVSRYVILAAILFMYMVLGCFMDVFAMMLLTLPIFFPVVLALGFDPIWFGVLVVRVMEIGMITPPVGMNLFIAKGVAKDIPMTTIIRGIVPFLIADICHVALLVAVPQIALFLPSRMR